MLVMQYSYGKKGARDIKAPSNKCCIWHKHFCVTDVSLVLHNEEHRVRLNQKCQQEESTHGLFSQRFHEQTSPNTISCSPIPGKVATSPQLSKTTGKLKIRQQIKSFQIQEIVYCFGEVFATPDIVRKHGLEIFLKR